MAMKSFNFTSDMESHLFSIKANLLSNGIDLNNTQVMALALEFLSRESNKNINSLLEYIEYSSLII